MNYRKPNWGPVLTTGSARPSEGGVLNGREADRAVAAVGPSTISTRP
jgi:hypothetical protein